MLHSKDKSYFNLIAVSFIAGLGGLLFGYDTGMIANVKEHVTAQFQLSDNQWSIVVSSTVLGAFLGALMSGIMADKVNRRTIILITSLGFILGAIIAACSTGFTTITLGRFILGYCIGIVSFSSPLYIAEIAPTNKRGSLVLLNGIAITSGETISFLVGYFLEDLSVNSWRWLFGLGIFPALILFIGMLFMPESPRWLIKQNEFEKARRVLNKIRHPAEIEQEIDEIKTNINRNSNGNWSALFSKSMRPVLIIGIGLGIFQQFAGLNTIMYYGPTIFKLSGFGSFTMSIFATFIVGFMNTIFTIITVFLIDWYGRRKLMLAGTFIAAISLFILGTCFYQHVSSKYLLLGSMVSYTAGYCISVGSLFWLIISEIYPLQLRGQAMSFVTAIQWAANFIVALSFLPMLNLIGEAFTFWIYAAMCFAACIFGFKFIPETKGISLESIEYNLMRGVPARYLGRI